MPIPTRVHTWSFMSDDGRQYRSKGLCKKKKRETNDDGEDEGGDDLEHTQERGEEDSCSDAALRKVRGEQGALTVFGVSEDGERIAIEFVGVPVQIKVELPPLHRNQPIASSPEEGEALALDPYRGKEKIIVDSILSACSFRGGSCPRNVSSMLHVSLTAGRPLYGFCGHERFAFLTIRTSHLWLLRLIQNTLSINPVLLPMVAHVPIKLNVGDADYDLAQRTMADFFGPPSAWYYLPEGGSDQQVAGGGVMIPSGHEMRVDHHFRFLFREDKEVCRQQLRLVPDEEAMHMAVPRIPVLSFDCEMNGDPNTKIDPKRPDAYITSMSMASMLGAGSGAEFNRNEVLFLTSDALPQEPAWVTEARALPEERRPQWLKNIVKEYGFMPTRDNAPPRQEWPRKVKSPAGPDATVTYFDDERSLLLRFIALCEEINPMVMTGYNHTYFDWALVVDRCKIHGIESQLKRLSMVMWKDATITESDKESNARMSVGKKYLDIPGCIEIDCIDLAKDFKSQNYKLETVAQQHLGEGKVPTNFASQWFLWWSGHYIKEVLYVLKDAILPLKLMCKWNTVLAMAQRSAVVGAFPRTFVDSMQQAMVDSMLTVRCSQKGFVMMNRDFQGFCSLDDAERVSAEARKRYRFVDLFELKKPEVAEALTSKELRPDGRYPMEDLARDPVTHKLRQVVLNPYCKPEWEMEREVAYPPDNPQPEGGLVQHPLFGISRGVGVLDFNSLYPMEQKKRKLCWTTIVVDPRYANLPGFQYKTMRFEDKESEKRYEFLWAQVEDAPIVGIVVTLKDLRDKYKILLKQATTAKKEALAKAAAAVTDEERQRWTEEAERQAGLEVLFDMRQLQVKLIMNSIYGFSCVRKGMGRRPCFPLGSSTTAGGREDITIVIQHLVEDYGLCIVYGDTDSAMPKDEAIERRIIDAEKAGDIDELNRCLNELHAVFKDAAHRIGVITGLAIEYENLYWVFVPESKKRYVVVKIAPHEKTVPSKLDERIGSKGTKTARGDSTKWSRKILKLVYKAALIERTTRAVLRVLAVAAMDLINGNVKLDECTKEQTLTKYPPYLVPPNKYVPDSKRYAGNVVHAKVAQREFNRDPKNAPVIGTKVTYLPVWPTDDMRLAGVGCKPGDKVGDRCVSVEEAIENGLKPHLAELMRGVETEAGQVLASVDPAFKPTKDTAIFKKASTAWANKIKRNFYPVLQNKQMGQRNMLLDMWMPRLTRMRSALETAQIMHDRLKFAQQEKAPDLDQVREAAVGMRDAKNELELISATQARDAMKAAEGTPQEDAVRMSVTGLAYAKRQVEEAEEKLLTEIFNVQHLTRVAGARKRQATTDPGEDDEEDGDDNHDGEGEAKPPLGIVNAFLAPSAAAAKPSAPPTQRMVIDVSLPGLHASSSRVQQPPTKKNRSQAAKQAPKNNTNTNTLLRFINAAASSRSGGSGSK